jgi:hypothetical protein
MSCIRRHGPPGAVTWTRTAAGVAQTVVSQHFPASRLQAGETSHGLTLCVPAPLATSESARPIER